MTPVEFATYVRAQTKSNTVTFPDATILSYMNVWQADIAMRIAKVNEDYFGMEFFRDLVAGQREYPLPDTILNNIKMVEAKLNGTDWRRFYEFDLNTYRVRSLGINNNPFDFPNYSSGFSFATTDEATIQRSFSDDYPQFDLFRKSLWLYTGSAISYVFEGLKLYGIVYPSNFTSLAGTDDMSIDPSSISAGFPRQFHELLARRVVIDYKTAQDRPMALSQNEQLYEVHLNLALDAIRNANLDRSVNGTRPYDDGSNY